MNNIGFQILRPILKLFSFICLNPKIEGKENIPKGAYIIASNHLSWLDPILIGNITPRTIHYLGKKELVDIPVFGWILRFMGTIRIDRSNKNPLAKKEAINNLEKGNIICIFPEGTRNKQSMELKDFKFGAVSFASKTGVPIIPITITKRPKLFRYGIKVIVGKPIYVKETDSLEKKNNELKKAISCYL